MAIRGKDLIEAFRIKGRRIPNGDRPPPGIRRRDDESFKIGTIMSVNPERQAFNVQLYGTKDFYTDVPIAHPYIGPGSYIGAMPEIGSNVILTFQNDMCFPIAYVPNLTAALKYVSLKVYPDDIRTEEKNQFQFRYRKLKPGQIDLLSAKGAELFLDRDTLIKDGLDNRINIRTDDGAIIGTSFNNYMFSGGIWRNSGFIVRNDLSKESNEGGYRVEKDMGEGRKKSFYLKPEGFGGVSDEYFTEYLIEVEERARKYLPVNDVNSKADSDKRIPAAVFALGNYVGNDSRKRGTYGKLLGVSLFSDPFGANGQFEFRPLTAEDIDRHSLAVTLYAPNKRNYELGAFFGIDKEGHFYQYIPSATGGGLGVGRSMSILARGSKKETWGSESAAGNSWDLNTTGGLKWMLGHHNDNNPVLAGRSIDIRTSKAAFFMFGEGQEEWLRDFDNEDKNVQNIQSYKKIEKVSGSTRIELSGKRETIIKSDDRLSIEGMKEEQIVGANTISVGSAFNIGTETFSVKVSKECQESFGSRKTTITEGSSELKIVRGDITENIVGKGDRTVTLSQGNIEETILTSGKRVFKTPSGKISNSTLSGDITNKTKSGKVVLDTKVGEISLKGSAKAILKASVGPVKVEGSKISLKGKSGGLSGVITKKSHKCYITGASLVPSNTVSATL